MTAQQASHGWRRPFDRWFDGLADGWALPLFFALFVTGWSLCLNLAYWDIGLNPDVVEMYVLGRDLAWGYVKHPPLPPWIMRAWTTLFPAADWPTYLLAMANSALALYFIDRLGRRYLHGDKRLVLLLVLVLVPGYHYLGFAFNHNTVLLVLWPLATWCFMRAFETRALGWAIAAGAAAALAMLGKYYSVFLLAGFAAAVLVHPDRWRYLRSLSPWVSAVTGAVVLAPHLVWLYHAELPPYAYAMKVHAIASRLEAVRFAFAFVGGALGYIAAPVIAWLLAARVPWRETHRAVFGALAPERRMLLAMTLATLLLPAATAIVLGTDMPPLWALPGLFLPILFVATAQTGALARPRAIAVAAVVAVFFGASIVGSPLNAWRESKLPHDSHKIYARAVAAELERRWDALAGTPLPSIAGHHELAWAVSYYASAHPRYIDGYDPRGIDAARFVPATIPAAGWVAICPAAVAGCRAGAARFAAAVPAARVAEFTVVPSLWGTPGIPAAMIAIMVAPAAR